MPLRVFVDTGYLEALADKRDQHHEAAKLRAQWVRGRELVTSEWVLAEFLAAVSKRDRLTKEFALSMVDRLRESAKLVRASHERFERALAHLRRRLDRTYSLVDCTSFEIMRRLSIEDALSHDKHFE